MGNPHRGEVSETIDGETYVLRLAANEWCGLEAEHGKITSDLMKQFFEMVGSGNLDMQFVRSFFRAALLGCRPDITLGEAGAIMGNIGLVKVGELLGRTIAASLPEDKEGDENPPKATAKRSTGRR